MSLITRMLKQTAVYWSPATLDDFGQPTWNAGVEISVRWEDVTEEFMDADGNLTKSRAKVFVSQDVVTKGVLMLGALESTVDDIDPKANSGAWEIRGFHKLPNIRATEFLRTAFL